jgi:hypothetical protein
VVVGKPTVGIFNLSVDFNAGIKNIFKGKKGAVIMKGNFLILFLLLSVVADYSFLHI